LKVRIGRGSFTTPVHSTMVKAEPKWTSPWHRLAGEPLVFEPLRKALHRAARAVKSQSGKALLRKRGMHLERSFEHILDQGGLRRATLKGIENLTKRYKIAAACFNLSVLSWGWNPETTDGRGL
jgi:Transposase DDE domain